ncbi:MAG: copper chaperone PCu(A)C [Hyphomicrobiaceae bacterium]
MRIFWLILVCIASTGVSWPVQSSDIVVGNLIIEKPWSRATPRGAKVGAGYLTIINTGADVDRLISVTSDVSKRVEIHATSLSGGIMRMRRLSKGIVIDSKSFVRLQPGGKHFMFVGLKQPLKKGASFQASLRFEKAGSVQVKFLISDIGGKSPYADDDTISGGSNSGTRRGSTQKLN